MDISYEGEAVGLNMMIDIWMYNSRRWVFKASGLVWEESEEGEECSEGKREGKLVRDHLKKEGLVISPIYKLHLVAIVMKNI